MEYGVGIRKKIRSHIQKIDIFSRKKIICGNDPKILPPSSTPLFPPKFDQLHPDFGPIQRHTWLEFSCFFVIPGSENSVFLEKRSQKASPKMQRFPTSSKCRKALFLIIFYGGSHMFHSDPRMRSMPNYVVYNFVQGNFKNMKTKFGRYCTVCFWKVPNELKSIKSPRTNAS